MRYHAVFVRSADPFVVLFCAEFSAAVLVGLVQALCNSCETLCLANVAATDAVATAVAEAISTTGCRLRSVDLSSDEISDTGAIALLRACAQRHRRRECGCSTTRCQER